MAPIQAASSINFSSSKGSKLTQLRARHREAEQNGSSNAYNLEMQIQALEAITNSKRLIREAKHAMRSGSSNHFFMGKLIAPSELPAIIQRGLSNIVSNRGILEKLQAPPRATHSDQAEFNTLCKQTQRERSVFGKPKDAGKIGESIPGYRSNGTIRTVRDN